MSAAEKPAAHCCDTCDLAAEFEAQTRAQEAWAATAVSRGRRLDKISELLDQARALLSDPIEEGR